MEDSEKIEILLPDDQYKTTIDWETVSEDELLRRSSVFSYDIKEARKRLRVKQNWIKFIIAHLYVDHILTALLAENLKRPDVYKSVGRRKYVLDKLEISEAMGWIDPDIVRMVKKLNSIRNSLSHDLSFIVSKKLINDFHNTFATTHHEMLKDTTDHQKNGIKNPALYEYLQLLLILLDINRQAVLRRQFIDRHRQRELHKAMLNARSVLENVKRETSTSPEES